MNKDELKLWIAIRAGGIPYREPGGPILCFDSVGECGDYYRKQGMTPWAISPVTLTGDHGESRPSAEMGD